MKKTKTGLLLMLAVMFAAGQGLSGSAAEFEGFPEEEILFLEDQETFISDEDLNEEFYEDAEESDESIDLSAEESTFAEEEVPAPEEIYEIDEGVTEGEIPPDAAQLSTSSEEENPESEESAVYEEAAVYEEPELNEESEANEEAAVNEEPAVNEEAAVNEEPEGTADISSDGMADAGTGAFGASDYEIMTLADQNSITLDITVDYSQSDARTILESINEFRTGEDAWYWNESNTEKIYCSDLPELVYDYDLEKVAMQRAAEIALFWSHTRPDGTDYTTAYGDYGYSTSSYGENTAVAQIRTLSLTLDSAAAFSAWLEEDAYYEGQANRRNMLRSDFTAVGIAGVYFNNISFWVVEFASEPHSLEETSPCDSEAAVQVTVDGGLVSSITNLSVTPDTYTMFAGTAEGMPVTQADIVLDDSFSLWSSAIPVTIHPNWTVSNGNIAEISGENLTAKAAGTTTMTANVLNNPLSVPVTVVQKISNCSVSIDPTVCTYYGGEQKPAVTVTDGTAVLTEGTDYAVSYSDNVNAGTAAVTVTGMGNYTGTEILEFQIEPAGISEAVVTLSNSLYTYDGSEKTPDAAVVLGSVTLVNGSDYTISYSSNVNAGTAAVIVTGMGNYTGEAAGHFEIEPADISAAAVSISKDSYTYDGAAKEPSVSVTMTNGTVLTGGTDYTVSYTDNVNAGTAKAAVTGTGNYRGTVTCSYTIAPASIKEAVTAVSETGRSYDGTAKEPSVTVTWNGIALTNGKDYTVSYKNNVDVGTGTVTVTGMGNFTDAADTAFTVEPADLSAASVSIAEDTYTYDGSAKEPAVTVTMAGKTLRENTDYTVTYKSNVDAGTAEAAVTGIGNYTGKETRTYTIKPASIAKAAVTVSEQSYTYDGTEKKPSVSVTLNGSALKNETDYTVSYSKNVNAGTAAATVTGRGNYTDAAEASFTIKQADLSSAKVSLSKDSYTYDGTAKEPSASVTWNGTALTRGTDYTVSYEDNVNAGTARAAVTGTGNFSGTVGSSYTIAPASIKAAKVSVSERQYTYDGTEKEPAVTVTWNGTVLKEETDYTVSYKDNVNAGTAEAAVTGRGNFTDTASAEFTVASANLAAAKVTFSKDTYTYDGTAKTPDVTVTMGEKTLKENTDYTVSFDNNTDAGTAAAAVTGKGNYTGTVTASFTIAPRSISEAAVTVSDEVYTGSAVSPDVRVTLDGTTLKETTDYTVSCKNNTSVGTASVTVTGTGNYTGSVTSTFTISEPTETENPEPEEATTTTALLLLSGTSKKTSVTLSWNKVQNADGYVVYGAECGSKLKKLTTVKGRTNTSWTQTDLDPKTEYKYKVKAYKAVNGKRVVLKTSFAVHLITKGGKYTNVRSVSASESSVSLSVGETEEVTVSYVLVNKSKKLTQHMDFIKFISSNTDVAKVNSNGKITAVGKGSCNVYAYAADGKRSKISVKVS